MDATILEAKQLVRTFGGGRTLFGREKPGVHAVREMELQVRRGETLGIVGESGCGKSTLARMLVGLDSPTSGDIYLEGAAMDTQSARQRHDLAKRIQYVFQDPVSSLNPRKTIRASLEAPMIHLLGLDRDARRRRLDELMDAVNLRPEFLDRYPHEFSGGQAQRIGIARALAAQPEILVLDEPVSALDVSVQAQVLNLLADLKDKYGLTYIFISHDLSVVEAVSDRVMVMYFGSVVELAESESLFRQPRHQYTKLLFDSVPLPGKRGVRGEDGLAELPDPLNPPKGCAFAPRCAEASQQCREAMPPLNPVVDIQHYTACYHPVGTGPQESQNTRDQ
ncbi:ABC transporter ATP-binding protein [Aestuariispira insulae]|uniref:Peptide/nickel transport system ATP-binding protein n=1 Tax=Aestuariispira insulae TaxID=1461337 RepID=A0A3D9H8J3_9PROT|nr:oligopeptide/dipeptide ABC transporter ATP-binding protein [Aestuariispira insulae]RED45820.1 peptide/nickel transport system ATP-binding protein [Aestuariispira insulae]